MNWRILAVVLLAGLPSVTACKPQTSASKSTAPATVAKPANEKDLATITLTPEAEKRLGIRTVEVRRSDVPRQRVVGGEVVVPPGKAMLVTAPVGGTLYPPKNGTALAPGAAVEKSQTVFTLVPLLSPERSVLTPSERVKMAESRAALATSLMDAERDVQMTKVKFEAAEIAQARAKQLLNDGVGTRQAFEDADAQLSVARQAKEAADSRLRLVRDIDLDTPAGAAAARPITAPVGGILSKVSAVPGATVVAGTPLFEVFEPNHVWLRVPVYVGQWRDVKPDAQALVAEFGQKPQPGGATAEPVAAPPSANPLAATVDLYYEMANDRDLRPGQKLAVTLTLRGHENDLTVPWAAVLHDIHGGTWVYERTAPQTFIRRRVHVRFVSGDMAVLAVGPKAGTPVVTDGAAELFGTEFGFGK